MSKSIQDLPEQAARVVRSYRKAVSQTKGKKLLSASGKQAHIEELTDKAKDELAALRDEGWKALKRLQAGESQPQGSTAAQQLSETRKARAWERLKPLLDSSSDVKGVRNGEYPDTLQVIQDAASSGDADTLAALQEELPAYLTSKRLDMYADILPKLISSKGSNGTTASPSPVDASGWKRVETAIAMAEHAVETATSQSKGSVPIDVEYEIPAYEDGETILIEGVESASEERDDFGRVTQTQSLPQLGAD